MLKSTALYLLLSLPIALISCKSQERRTIRLQEAANRTETQQALTTLTPKDEVYIDIFHLKDGNQSQNPLNLAGGGLSKTLFKRHARGYEAPKIPEGETTMNWTMRKAGECIEAICDYTYGRWTEEATNPLSPKESILPESYLKYANKKYGEISNVKTVQTDTNRKLVSFKSKRDGVSQTHYKYLKDDKNGKKTVFRIQEVGESEKFLEKIDSIMKRFTDPGEDKKNLASQYFRIDKRYVDEMQIITDTHTDGSLILRYYPDQGRVFSGSAKNIAISDFIRDESGAFFFRIDRKRTEKLPDNPLSTK